MKTSERHHLKDNELALALGQAGDFAARNRRTMLITVATILLLAVATGAFFAWRNAVDTRSREALAQAMVVLEARVAPPAPGADPAVPVTQQPGTFPTEKAKLEAALPKLLAAADGYPETDSGRTARYNAAVALVGLGRYDEAIKHYDQVAGAGGLLGESSRLGKAEAQLRAGQHDAAIGAFKQLSEQGSSLPKEAILLELARAYRAAGKTDDARKTLNQIVEQHADSPFAATAKQELEKIKS